MTPFRMSRVHMGSATPDLSVNRGYGRTVPLEVKQP